MNVIKIIWQYHKERTCLMSNEIMSKRHRRWLLGVVTGHVSDSFIIKRMPMAVI